ncbi:MAG: hypothetical protein RLZZ241_374 [Bacteroidota bacterium]
MQILKFAPFFFAILAVKAQDPELKTIQVRHINQEIYLDGNLDEVIWNTADTAGEFWQYFPADSIYAKEQSEIKMLYDDTNLYIGMKVYTAGTDFAIQSLRRDFRAGNADNITLLFDTFNDGNNAFLFGTNPYGVQREGLVAGGGLDLTGFSISWDVKWRAEAVIHDTYYTAELIIPMAAFKFREGERRWRFNSYRFDTQSNESSTWVHIPQNQNIYGLTFMGEMVFEKPLGKSRMPMALIPFINTGKANDFDAGTEQFVFKTGGDAKISIGNSMNLDVTLNPDFSQVEVDDQVTNLTRFEVSLPEKRQFFIDNSDLFSGFGDQRDANPFFSRRIGIARDTSGNTIENKIIGGVRLSGKLNNRLRLGFFNIQTEADATNQIASNNNSMIALQHLLFSRSNVGFFVLNREATGKAALIDPNERFNRVAGIDYNLISSNNVWSGQFYFHKSFSPEKKDKDASAGSTIRYNSRNWNGFAKWVYLGEDFQSDLGFVRRTDMLKSVTSVARVFWPERGIFNSHSFEFTPFWIWRPSVSLQNTDSNMRFQWEAKFKNQSGTQVRWNHEYTYLFDDFDPTRVDGAIPLPAGSTYNYNSLDLQYNSDLRKKVAVQFQNTIGQFYNGNVFSLQGTLNLRFQPKTFVSLMMNYDRISLPEPYSKANIWLISPKFEITFSKSLFWNTLIQYSNQRDNLGVNSRLQWRFAPLSDLFLVYTDNYYVDRFSPRYRSVNLKLTYWLNI